MPFALSDDEYLLLEGLSISIVIDLAAELDVIVPEKIDRRTLLTECVLRLVDHGKAHGLPFSKYDAEDLSELSPEDLIAIGRLQGLTGRVTVSSIVRKGNRANKQFAALRNDHPIPTILPMLLTAVARAARTR